MLANHAVPKYHHAWRLESVTVKPHSQLLEFPNCAESKKARHKAGLKFGNWRK
jgi:hypothetical protein